MKIGFLIVNYNDSETTLKLLNNIKDYKIIDKIVVVDNKSTDNSYRYLKKIENDKIKIIKNKENKGYGSGINFGSKHLISLFKECFIIVSNPDIEIENETVIQKLINSFDSNTAIIAPIVKEHEGLNRGWKIPTPIKDSILNLPVIHKFLRSKLLGYKKNYYNGIVNVEVVSGSFFIINSGDLKEANYFDENVFLYYEENIIAKKVHRKILINSDVEVYHNHSVTIDKNINTVKKYKELKKSQMYFQKKYNNANPLEIFLLFITNKLTLLLLSIVYLFKR